MKIPPPLQKGDTVALASPARFVTPSEVAYFTVLTEKHGWTAKVDEACFAKHNQFGGTDNQRVDHLQSLIDNPEVKAIFCSRGGYGSLRIIDSLSFAKLKTQPKWMVGFSDITVFHAHLQSIGIGSLHAPMPFNISLGGEAQFQTIAQFLQGKPEPTILAPHPLDRQGETSGILTGGNLSILYALKGSASMPDMNGKILFIEDVDEYLYHIDRMMLSLRRAGLLAGLAGLLVGAFTDIKDHAVPFGKQAYEIVREHVDDYGFPVSFGFPAGHIMTQQPLLMGANIRLEVASMGTKLTYFA